METTKKEGRILRWAKKLDEALDKAGSKSKDAVSDLYTGKLSIKKAAVGTFNAGKAVVNTVIEAELPSVEQAVSTVVDPISKAVNNIKVKRHKKAHKRALEVLRQAAGVDEDGVITSAQQ